MTNPTIKNDKWTKKIAQTTKEGIKNLTSYIKKNKKNILMVSLFVMAGLSIASYVIGVYFGGPAIPSIVLYIGIVMLATALMLIPKIFNFIDKIVAGKIAPDEKIAVFKDVNNGNIVIKDFKSKEVLEKLFSVEPQNRKEKNEAIEDFQNLLKTKNFKEITIRDINLIIDKFINRELEILQKNKHANITNQKTISGSSRDDNLLSDAKNRLAHKIKDAFKNYSKFTGKDKADDIDLGKPNNNRKNKEKNYLLEFINKEDKTKGRYFRTILISAPISSFIGAGMGIGGISIGPILLMMTAAIILPLIGAKVANVALHKESIPEIAPTNHKIGFGV